MDRDLYSTLQVDPAAEPEVIQAAYMRLAAKYHPDHNNGPDANERMKAINEAYHILRDPAKRSAYDAKRKLRQTQSNSGGQSSVGGTNPSTSDYSSRVDPAPNPTYSATPSKGHIPPYCDLCGRKVPTGNVTLYQNIGMILIRRHKRLEANLCRSCMSRYSWEMTLVTLFLGWWGPISVLITPLILFNNLGVWMFSLTLPSSFDRASGFPKGSWGTVWAAWTVIGLGLLIVCGTIALSYPSFFPSQTGTIVPTASAALQSVPRSLPQDSGAAVLLPTPTRDILTGFARITVMEKTFCGPNVEIYAGPGYGYRVLDKALPNYSYKVYAVGGDWFYLGQDSSGNHYFINSTSECMPTSIPAPSRLPTVVRATVSAQAVPTATRAAVRNKPPESPTPDPYGEIFRPTRFPTPSAVCKGYRPSGGSHALGLFPEKPYVRGLTRPNGIRVYYDASEAEYWDDNEKGIEKWFWCPAEAEAEGFVSAHPR